MNIVINDTSYKIKYGYLVVSKSEIIPKVVETMNGMSDASEDYGFITRLMETVADMLLYGLQKAHADEFGFNFITKEGYDEKYAKVCDLIDDYLTDGGKITDLFNQLSEELLNKGFLGEIVESESNPQTTETTEESEDIPKMIPMP